MNMFDGMECKLIKGLKDNLAAATIGRLQADPSGLQDKVMESQITSPKVVCEAEEIHNNLFMNREEAALTMDIFKPCLPENPETSGYHCDPWR